MKFRVQLVKMTDDGRDEFISEIAILNKGCHRIEDLGLTLAESKEVLRKAQEQIVTHQVGTFLEIARSCHQCDARLKTKGHHQIAFRTLFGKIRLNSPRLRHGQCGSHENASFSPLTSLLSERTSPELLMMEAKWASLISYGMTVKAFNDFLPMDEKLNAETIRNHIHRVADRCEAELGEERVFFIDGCPRDWNQLPEPEGPITWELMAAI